MTRAAKALVVALVGVLAACPDDAQTTARSASEFAATSPQAPSVVAPVARVQTTDQWMDLIALETS